MRSNAASRFMFPLALLIACPLWADQGGAGDQPAPALSPAAAAYRTQCDTNLDRFQQDFRQLESIEAPYNAGRVLAPLNAFELRLGDALNQSSLYESVHPDADVRDVARDCTAAFNNLATRLSLSRPVYEAVEAVDVAGEPADTRRYHFVTLRNFRLAGVDKNDETREKIRALNEEITRLGQLFDRNILEDVRYIEVDPEELVGLPEDFIANRPVQENGKIRLSTRYTDTIPVYTYARSDEVRRRLRQADRSRAHPENREILEQLLARRHELARLLGFDNFADYITADKMIGSADNARAFIRRIHKLAAPAAEKDVERLLAELRKTRAKADTVQRWQAMYLEEQIRKSQYQVDAAELRQYFSYAKVRDGIFRLVTDLFDVTIKPWDTETWHPSVESYEMYRDGELIARFHMDMHPRQGKYQHAAAFTTRTGIAGEQLPVSTLVCNFAGGSDPDTPMEFSEVRTFLHEFGHLLHALFGGHQRWAALSGIATEWDFVEAPSQMLEEWMYDRETLQTFAINDQGEPIPGELVAKINEARHLGEGLTVSIQMYYAAMSLEFHRLPPEQFDLLDKMLELEAEYSPLPHQEDTYFYANLGHLNGYSALYYTYMWSKVIALDMFSEFEKEGLRSTELATRFRDRVLAPGGTRPASELVHDFLGRPYNFEAFAKRLRGEL